MEKRQQGQITVFLSLSLSLILSIVCTVVESARVQAIKLRIETVADMGIHSVFSEYHRELFELYGLLFLDGSYESDSFMKEKIENRYKEYMGYNLENTRKYILGNHIEFYKTKAEEVDIEQLRLATDYGGEVLKQQAILDSKNRNGITLIEKLLEAMPLIESIKLGMGEVEKRNKEIDEMDISKDIEINLENSKQENPIEAVQTIKKSGILQMVLENPDEVSKKVIHDENGISKRTLNKGNDTTFEYAANAVEELLFGEYILERFENALNTTQEGALDYETEYILCGKKSDQENLKGVINKLLLIREGSNFIYLLGDHVKMSEAEMLAELLVGFTGIVPLIYAVQILILLSWAYAESILDVRSLMHGGKVPLLKGEEDWILTLTDITELAEILESGKSESKEGFNYEDYLAILLIIENKDKKLLRCMDYIECRIRTTKNNRFFQLDYCVDKIETSIRFDTGKYEMDKLCGYSY